MPSPARSPSASSLRGLLPWFERHRRDLPWRHTCDPYQIWIAEVMLQQTTVRTALPRFEAFLARFPDVATLAGASEEDVVAAWSGLGYYHRARNLHRAARYLLERHAGRFPRGLPAALAVPGVGLYTASAVLSIAFGLPLPVVDGNVRRVLARIFTLRGKAWRKDSSYYNLAGELLDTRAPGAWNQALMELGATICAPRRPACPACPVARTCLARAQGVQETLPEGRTARPAVAVTVAAALIEKTGRFLLVRREGGRLLGGMWEVPQTSLDGEGRPALVRELRDRHGLEVTVGPLLATTRHAITYRRIRVEVFSARLTRPPALDPEQARWVTPAEARSLPVSSLTHKILRARDASQLPLSFG